jgi:hypothetical protein
VLHTIICGTRAWEQRNGGEPFNGTKPLQGVKRGRACD